MAYERTCTRCGAFLDANERNDPCDECMEEIRNEQEYARQEHQVLMAGVEG